MSANGATKNWARYEVGVPKSLETFPLTGPEQAQMAAPPPPRSFAETQLEPRAVWVVHGMGQQIPFETVDSLTQGLLNEAHRRDPAHTLIPTARSVRIGDQVVQRVELVINRPDNNPVELHLYEAYWAPLTEGVAKLRDVISFLFDGGSRGLLNSVKSFKRAMFGGICNFKIRKRVPFFICSALLVLAALAFINAVIVAASAKKLQIIGSSLAILADQWPVLTALANVLSAVTITFGAMLFITMMWQSHGPSAARRFFLSLSSWLGAILAAVSIVAGAALMLLVVWNHWKPARLTHLHFVRLQIISTALIIFAVVLIALGASVRARARSAGQRTEQNVFLLLLLLVAFGVHIASIVSPFVFSHWLFGPPANLLLLRVLRLLARTWWVWPFLIFISSQIRTFLVEYVGDVAIYVTANKIDRFNDVRQRIKEVARKSASAIFLAQAANPTHFEYEKIAIIGHSLGSVIAYDTLNRLMNDDRLSGGKLRVAERTALFETFGSPLNKVAFLFTIQGTDTFQVREQLAESVQPMIIDYTQYRTFPWINVRSRNDIISGEVYLYDWCDCQCSGGAPAARTIPPGIRAKDLVDPDACVALAAHVEYWKNSLIWEVLYDHITR